MSQPGPEGGIPAFGAMPVDPFELRLAQLQAAMRLSAEQAASRSGEAADYAGTVLTAREVQLARWFYEAGQADTAAPAAPAEAAPAGPEEAARPADPAQPGPERAPTREGLTDAFQRYPMWMSVTATPTRRRQEVVEPVHFQNAASQTLISAMQRGGEQGVQYAAPTALVAQNRQSDPGVGLFSGPALRQEVLVTSQAPNTYNRFVEDPANPGQAVGEPLVVVHYNASFVLGEAGDNNIDLTAVVPVSLAKRLDALEETDPRGHRKLLMKFLQNELPADAAEEQGGDHLDAVEPDPESDIVYDAEARYLAVVKGIETQPKRVMVKASNVPGIAGNGERGARPDANGYVRKQVELPSAAPAANPGRTGRRR
jgi:hypothetical protein